MKINAAPYATCGPKRRQGRPERSTCDESVVTGSTLTWTFEEEPERQFPIQTLHANRFIYFRFQGHQRAHDRSGGDDEFAFPAQY